MYILLAILIFGLFILTHELGHYLFARLFKVTIKEFSIGMGPKIISKTSKKTNIAYSLRAFPIGGYVAMVGENDDGEDDPNALTKKPVWQRLIITAAGGIVNILCGFILSLAMILSTAAIGGTTIAAFDENATSPDYGLMVGDEIVSVDHTKTYISSELVYEISRCTEGPVDITVKRNGKIIELENVEFKKELSEGIIFGECDFKVEPVRKNFGNVLKHSFRTGILSIKMIWQSLGDLLSGKYGMDAVSGPIGVTETLSNAARESSVNFLYLCSVIAINLGLVNLLPIPALDGGRIVFMLIELIMGKPVDRKIETAIHSIGIMILMVLMAVVTFKDIGKLF